MEKAIITVNKVWPSPGEPRKDGNISIHIRLVMTKYTYNYNCEIYQRCVKTGNALKRAISLRNVAIVWGTLLQHSSFLPHMLAILARCKII